jgi:anti-sigma regulatory factor (Ser/Thr protein kinase)
MHASLADIVADVAANSIEAGARLINVSIEELEGRITLKVSDNGKGMDEGTLKRAFDPFWTEPGKHEARKIGMGLPFVKQTCDTCGGAVRLESEKGVGTTILCTFDASNIDTPPIGNLSGAALSLFTFDGEYEMIFAHRTENGEYEIARSELADAVGGFNSVEGLSLAKEFLQGQEEALS